MAHFMASGYGVQSKLLLERSVHGRAATALNRTCLLGLAASWRDVRAELDADEREEAEGEAEGGAEQDDKRTRSKR